MNTSNSRHQFSEGGEVPQVEIKVYAAIEDVMRRVHELQELVAVKESERNNWCNQYNELRKLTRNQLAAKDEEIKKLKETLRKFNKYSGE